jgi:hypothetical protein
MFRWLFRSKSGSPPVEERLETVERRLRALSDDWEEFHEKVQRAVWRNAKRRDPVESPDLPSVSPEQPARHQLGSPRAPRQLHSDPISDAIRARRGMRLVHDPATLGNGEDK